MKRFLTGGRVITVTGQTYEEGDILISGSKIREVGHKLERPSDAEIIDVRGLTVTPGLIDAHTHIGTYTEGYPIGMDDTNDMTSPITPGLRVLDALYPGDMAFIDAIAGGVTCAQTLPGSTNVIGGQGVIVKTKPDIVERMVVRAPSALKGALGENPIRIYGSKDKLPSTRMGSAYLMREAFTKARSYRERRRGATKKGKPFETDLSMEPLVDALDRKLSFHIHCHRADDIQTAVRVSEEFGLDFTIEHCTEGHLIADWLAEKHIRAAVGPTLTCRSKLELSGKTWDTPRALYEAGVHFCIITDHPVIPLENVAVCASLACRAGLPPDEALKAITIYAAEHIEAADRMGSIEPGKDADLAIWDGDPLCSRTKAVMTIINGETVFER